LDATGNPMLVLDPVGLSQQARDYRRSSSGRGAAGGGFGLPKHEVPRVLVVDDSLTTRMMEQSILESAGYHVDLAVSAEEALKRVEQQSYSLFLVDVEMPGMDGFTFVAQTRADARLRDTPAVLVSSRSDPEDLARGRAAGAAGYVIKSRFDQRELLALIERLIAT
jgi:two-component system chemotaxis sensor kinase CheA